MRKIIIVGATSGLGRGVAELFIQNGWQVGIAGRRIQLLEEIQKLAPNQVSIQRIDVQEPNAHNDLLELVEKVGGMDYYFHVAGIGFQNEALDTKIEIQTTQTNVTGFVNLIDTAFNYMKTHQGGHIGAISSIAGTKGLGTAPAYSATKRFNYTYIQALAQLSKMTQAKVTFSDIRPGFVDTALLNSEKHYPMLMKSNYASKIIYKALIHKKRIKIIDWKYTILVALWRCIPRILWERLNIKN